MVAPLEILVVCTHEKILATVLRLLNTKAEWTASGVTSAEEVLPKCSEKEYQVLLLGAGLRDDIEQELTAAVKLAYPLMHIIPHYGGGSGLLFAEIYVALAQ